MQRRWNELLKPEARQQRQYQLDLMSQLPRKPEMVATSCMKHNIDWCTLFNCVRVYVRQRATASKIVRFAPPALQYE